MLEVKPEFCSWPGCNKQLHPEVARYSWNAFGKPLCIAHQKLERLKRYPKKVARFINKEVGKKHERN